MLANTTRSQTSPRLILRRVKKTFLLSNICISRESRVHMLNFQIIFTKNFVNTKLTYSTCVESDSALANTMWTPHCGVGLHPG